MTVHKLTERLLPGEVNNDLVEALESLTDRARKGEIIAMAWAGVTGNDAVINGWEGSGGTLFSLSAAVMLLHTRYAQSMMDADG